MGSKECHVPLGVIRRRVAWFGVELIQGEDRLFVARRNPNQGFNSSTDIHVVVGTSRSDDVPDGHELYQNTDLQALRSLLGRLIGLGENLFVPPEGHTRSAFEANFSHARIYCYQDQSLIDNKNQLFFSAQDAFVAQAIRDTIPFFVGAASETELLDRFELNRLKRELRLLQRKIDARANWAEESFGRANALLAEARQVALLRADARPTTAEDAYRLLREALAVPLNNDFAEEGGMELEELLTRRDELRRRYLETTQRIEEAVSLASNRDAYQSELGEQRSRLKAVSIIPVHPEGAVACPLCHTEVEIVSDALSFLIQELEETGERITALHQNNPRMQSYIKELRDSRAVIQTEVEINQAQINAIVEQSAALADLREDSIRRSRIQGRISSFLDASESPEDDVESDANVLAYRIEKLESTLSGESYEDRLRHAESNISDFMSSYAKELDLEHSEGRTRLDFRRLTVVADTPQESIRLENMGSGDNWVGCHVIAHAALHRWFRLRDRPVPAFLILDQPSKAHYPPSQDQVGAAIDDDDRRAVVRLFKFLCGRSVRDDFQIIVVDHADESEEWFQDAIVERWRGGLKLVPDDWPEA